MFADQFFDDEEGDLRQSSDAQGVVVIILGKLQVVVILPVLEEVQGVEVLQPGDAAEAKSEVVALPGDLVLVKQVNNDGEIQAASVQRPACRWCCRQ